MHQPRSRIIDQEAGRVVPWYSLMFVVDVISPIAHPFEEKLTFALLAGTDETFPFRCFPLAFACYSYRWRLMEADVGTVRDYW